MNRQNSYFDGEYPKVLLIPFMTLTDAKSWSGQAYSALFVMGLPKGSFRPQKSNYYTYVNLSTINVMNGDVIKDATVEQIEQTRMTLIHAVLALRSLLAKMDDERIQSLGIKHGDGLRQARTTATKTKCWLPQNIPEGSNDRKPLCLVKFGGAKEVGKHPPPDPLLLAYKAAGIWAKMTPNFRLLANGEKPNTDDDMSEDDMSLEEMSLEEMPEEDCIAEVAFFDDRNRGGYTKQSLWAQELAVNLRQPYGYQG